MVSCFYLPTLPARRGRQATHMACCPSLMSQLPSNSIFNLCIYDFLYFTFMGIQVIVVTLLWLQSTSQVITKIQNPALLWLYLTNIHFIIYFFILLKYHLKKPSFFIPGSKTHQHLKLAILPNVSRSVVDSSDKATEIPGPCLPILFWDHFILFKGLIIRLCFFLKRMVGDNEYHQHMQDPKIAPVLGIK